MYYGFQDYKNLQQHMLLRNLIYYNMEGMIFFSQKTFDKIQIRTQDWITFKEENDTLFILLCQK